MTLYSVVLFVHVPAVLGLAMRMSAFELAWPRVTVGPLLLIAPLGALTGRRMRATHRACADAKAINSQLLSRLQDPALKISLGIRIAVFFAILLLMAASRNCGSRSSL
jgi:hypothetical protein